MKPRALRLAALAVITGCSSTPPPVTPEPAEAEAVDTTALDVFFRTRFPADEPGIAVLIAKRGRTVFARGYGIADLETREPITTQTLFNLGSLSKTFVANAILILEERGKVSVDDPLSKYFPDFEHPALAAKVRLRHLLTHTSGLPDNRPVEAEWDFYLTARDEENWYPITQADALEFEPGSRFAYSNPTFNALALIIEKVTGQKWQTFIRDQIFLPAGMTTSTITDGPYPDHGVAHGYEKVEGQWRELDYGEEPTFAAAGNGGVWSSVEELALYEAALKEGRFLRPATVADSRTIKRFANWASDEPPKIGWSWWFREIDGFEEIGHTGRQGGFQANYFVIPEKNVLVIYLMNETGDFDGVRDEIHRWLREVNWMERCGTQRAFYQPNSRSESANLSLLGRSR